MGHAGGAGAYPHVRDIFRGRPRESPSACGWLESSLDTAPVPVIGASRTLAANAVVLLAPFRPGWREWPRRHAVAVVLLALLAADDSLQHALGWHTPIDSVWKAGGRRAMVNAAEVVANAV